MSRPIEPTPVLRGRAARRFERLVEEGLKSPLGPIPTPRLGEALRLIKEQMKKLERVARIICEDNRQDPDKLEPGNRQRVDSICPNGDPGHYMWRKYVPLAAKILNAIE